MKDGGQVRQHSNENSKNRSKDSLNTHKFRQESTETPLWLWKLMATLAVWILKQCFLRNLVHRNINGNTGGPYPLDVLLISSLGKRIVALVRILKLGFLWHCHRFTESKWVRTAVWTAVMTEVRTEEFPLHKTMGTYTPKETPRPRPRQSKWPKQP